MNLFKPQTEQFIKNAEDKETLKNTRGQSAKSRLRNQMAT